MPNAPATASAEGLRDAIAARLEQTRARTLALVDQLSEDALNRVHDPLMSPIVWDLGHMAAFEDLWLVQNAFGAEPLRAQLEDVYDPFTAPREGRGQLPYLRSDDCLSYMEAVRRRTLECLARADLSADSERLLADGYVYELVLHHEMQHSETILQTIQLMTCEPYQPQRAHDPLDAPLAAAGDEMLPVPAGEFEMGADKLVFSYDNERPPYDVWLDAFRVDRTPVTNGAYIDFIQSGGYQRAELWSDDGWRWVQREQRSLPRYWQRDGDTFSIRSFSSWAPADPSLPVCHVSWFEADAYARSVGKRLPSEHEWEKAASWSSSSATKQAYPWGEQPSHTGRANLDQLGFGSSPGGSYPDGASPCGALQMIGDVWEWTASRFGAYPDFEPYPYRQYSQEFFGGPYRVLRGGAWSTQPQAVSSAFRNWDHPDRSQLFAGFRCALDAEPAARA
ncbi:MAG: ergothioneine biosynthesis protein EgtB [Solirubrobacterales bacterium]